MSASWASRRPRIAGRRRRVESFERAAAEPHASTGRGLRGAQDQRVVLQVGVGAADRARRPAGRGPGRARGRHRRRAPSDPRARSWPAPRRRHPPTRPPARRAATSAISTSASGVARAVPRRRPGTGAAAGPSRGRRPGAARPGRRAAGPRRRWVSSGGSVTGAASASACNTRRSRRPPLACLRSGSSRWATSPSLACRSRVMASSPASRFFAPPIHRSRTVARTRSPSSRSPATGRPSSRLSTTFRSSPATATASFGRAHAVVERDPGVPDRVPEPFGDLGDVAAAVVEQHEIEIARRARARGGRARRRRRPTTSGSSPSSSWIHSSTSAEYARAELGAAERAVVDERGAPARSGTPAGSSTRSDCDSTPRPYRRATAGERRCSPAVVR